MSADMTALIKSRPCRVAARIEKRSHRDAARSAGSIHGGDLRTGDGPPHRLYQQTGLGMLNFCFISRVHNLASSPTSSSSQLHEADIGRSERCGSPGQRPPRRLH